MITFLKTTFNLTWFHRKMLFFVYLWNLIFAIIFGIIIFNFFVKSSQNSLAFNSLLEGFDSTIIGDYFQKDGKDFTKLIVFFPVFGLIYTIIQIFFNGGVLEFFLQKKPFSVNSFLQSSSKWFGKFFVLFLINSFAILIVLILGIIITVVFAQFSANSTEQGKFWLSFIGFLITALLLSVLLLIADIAKVILFNNPTIGIFKAYQTSFGYFFRNPLLFRLFWFMLFLGFVLFMLMQFLTVGLPMGSFLSILLVFILFQIAIFSKIFLQNWSLQNIFHYYSSNPLVIETPILETDDDKLSN